MPIYDDDGYLVDLAQKQKTTHSERAVITIAIIRENSPWPTNGDIEYCRCWHSERILEALFIGFKMPTS